ncbi:MAG: GNAT family N-acetyltransferase [Rhizobiaceae bacterium MnEN-MB40S]|nr:MAG: GNAT family N-acetyltransferase [Rhizobiaceae bacterium MnEN-MB40S]
MTAREKPRPRGATDHRLKRMREANLRPQSAGSSQRTAQSIVDCGWGRLIFANTFLDTESITAALRRERPDRRDIAFYVQEPQVAVALAPQELFLDPSLTYRLDLTSYRPARRRKHAFFIRRLTTVSDAEAVNVIYSELGMVQVPLDFFWEHRDARKLTVLVAEDTESGAIMGSVMGVDHTRAFNDPERGSSLWCLAVSPKAPYAGIGESLVRRLAEHFQAREAAYMDLSVLHDNTPAIGLYEKLGFRRVPVFAVKRKNPINEKLFVGQQPDADLNPYAKIVVNEARRRGIAVEIVDAEGGFFRLSHGGRSILCREALSELTTAVAMSICDDKRVTRRIVEKAGVKVPAQLTDDNANARAEFLAAHGSVVVKPARGEQGMGVAVGLTDAEEMEAAVDYARSLCPDIVIEECFEGSDLRLVVIDYKVVAAAIRKPARIVGDGVNDVRKLIEVQSRRRASATGGESTIPIDAETERCLANAGLGWEDVPDQGREILVRKTANLHTGGTIEDVTAETHPALIEAAVAAARAIQIPVTGIDLMVRSPREPDYVFIEANERPGLANHEPQPTAERYVDLMFPFSAANKNRKPDDETEE